MKKFTLLQSAFALIAAFMLALPARAQVASAADLYGTYKFTATVNVTEAGQALKDNFKEECEVKITKCSIGVFDGEIVGFAGAANAQSIYSVDVNNNTITIRNPNGNYDIWDGKVHMSNAEGIYPYGGAYGDIVYTFDPATKTITLPDFTLVTVDHATSSATIAASFTNAKMTLVEAENVNVTDLSGNWHFKAVTGGFNTMENSTLPTEWDMTLTASDDTKKAYNISLTLGDFAPLALTGTFDGVTLTIPFNETYFDADNKIGIVNMYGVARPGEVTFNLLTENSLSLTSGMTIAQDSISPEVKGGYLQWYMAGTAKRESGDQAAFTWDGTFHVKAGSIMKNLAEYEYPEEFDMVVTYLDAQDIYLVTNFFGEDVVNLNYGGLLLTPSAEDPNKAEIGTGSLKSIEAGAKYLALRDMNLSDAPIVITRQEDGTFIIEDFCISYMTYDENWNKNHAFAAMYQNVTATQEVVAKPEPFDWYGTYTVTGQVESKDGGTYLSTFEMEIIYHEQWGMSLVTKLYDADVTGLNYGGIDFTIAADNQSAEMKTDTYIKSIEAGSTYYKVYDKDGGNSTLTFTVNEDGTLSISDFTIGLVDFNNNTTTTVAVYTNVKAEKKAIAEPEPFDWYGTYAVTGQVESKDGGTYLSTFEMEIIYHEQWEMSLVTKLYDTDVTGLNYGGIDFTIAADNQSAEMKTDTYIKSIEAGSTYYKVYDKDGGNSTLTFTVNEDGTLSISDFTIGLVDFNNNTTTTVAVYTNVKAEKKASSIEENVVEVPALKAWSANGSIYVAGEAQYVEVYDMSGRTVFAGVASEVNGLNKGLYLVKVKNAVAKVAVK